MTSGDAEVLSGADAMKAGLPVLAMILAAVITVSLVWAQYARPNEEAGFQTVRRPGSVDIDREYTLTNLRIPKNQIHTLLPRDAIPALTDPTLEPVADATWLPNDARIIAVKIGKETVGVPLRVLDWHEVVNMTIGGEPIAVTYCPLCDSATVFSRRVTPPGGGEAVVLEFGISGALYNSNVLMYDRRDKALWSQLGMQAVSGPWAGTMLDMLPVRVEPLATFRETYPRAQIVSRQTGHKRNYSRSPYKQYFADQSLMVPVAAMGDTLPRKTLGLGIVVGNDTWFVPAEAIDGTFTLRTPAGPVRVLQSDAGVYVQEAPAAARTAQTFYYSWSAFFPQTKVARESDESVVTPGLTVGTTAPDATLLDMRGKTVRLATLYRDRPVVLTFYRGGWCPFCSRALADWQTRLEDVQAAGGIFVAVSPEKTPAAVQTAKDGNLTYQILSDPQHKTAKAFNVHFVMDDTTREKYLGYGKDLSQINASGTWELPAPATFVIDRESLIRYAFATWDYRQRANPDKVIDVLKSLQETE